MILCLVVGMYMCVQEPVKARGIRSPELELQAIVSGLRSSTEPASDLNCSATSPSPRLFLRGYHSHKQITLHKLYLIFSFLSVHYTADLFLISICRWLLPSKLMWCIVTAYLFVLFCPMGSQYIAWSGFEPVILQLPP